MMSGVTKREAQAIEEQVKRGDGDKMLLHRTGAFEGDMLFDPLTDTFVRYGAFPVQTEFMLHTEKYAFAETEEGLTIDIKYVL